jgi:Flp pilus assembly protein TadD
MKKYFLTILIVASLFTISVIPNLTAYDNSDDEEEEFSPWAAWRKGFSYFEKGERSKDSGQNKEALAFYKKAHQCYLSVKKARPKWNQQIIDSRIKMCEREIKRLDALLGEDSLAKAQSSFERKQTMNAELQTTKAELINYKKKLFSALIELNELRQRSKQQKNTAQQIEDLMREKRIINEEYKLLQEKYANLQNQKNKPDLDKERLQTQLVDIKIQNDLLVKRLNLQKEKETELNEEMASLYRYKTQNKDKVAELNNIIKNLEYKIQKIAEQQSKDKITNQKKLAEIKSLETYNKQLAANLKDKEKEIEKLDEWLKNLRHANGSQSEVQQEIIKTNQEINQKYKELKKKDEKNVLEIQQLNSLIRQNNIAEVQLKKTLQEINTHKETIENEYKMLRKSYDNLLSVQDSNTNELKMLRTKLSKAEELVKSYSEECKWLKNKLSTRSNSDLRNITSLNKQIRDLNKEIDSRNVSNKKLKFELDSVKNKYKNLQDSFESLKEINNKLKVNEKLLSEENIGNKDLKTQNEKLLAENKYLRSQKSKLVASKLEEYKKKTEENDNKILSLQKQNQILSDENRKLSLITNERNKLQEQLQHANKTIEILRNVQSGKASTQKTENKVVKDYKPLITTPEQPVDLKKLLADGIKAENDDSDDLAIWNYRKYLNSNPNDSAVNRRLGTILLKRNQVDEAANLLQKAYVLDSENIKNASVYSSLLIKVKKYGNACAILQKALKKNPNDYNLMIQYSKAQAGIGQTATALDILAQAIKAAPKKSEAYLAQAQIIAVYHPDLLDTAAKSYRKARKLGAKPDVYLEEVLAKKLADNSEMIQFLQKPALESEKNKDWVSAAWYFGQLQKLKPEEREYCEKLAAALLLQDKYKQSIAALDLKKPSNETKLIAAVANLCQGNYEQAEEYMKEIKQPQKMKVYFEAVKEYLKSLKPDKNQQKEFTKVYTKLNKLL